MAITANELIVDSFNPAYQCCFTYNVHIDPAGWFISEANDGIAGLVSKLEGMGTFTSTLIILALVLILPPDENSVADREGKRISNMLTCLMLKTEGGRFACTVWSLRARRLLASKRRDSIASRN